MASSLLDSLRAVKTKMSAFIREDDLHGDMQRIANLLPKGDAFVYAGIVFIPSEVSRKLLSFNQLYARCLISKIKEIQHLKTDEEVTLVNELFSLLSAEISLIVINGQTYHNTGKKAGVILTEEEILLNIINS